jgi:GNAT superfamily N-acetyltransferase
MTQRLLTRWFLTSKERGNPSTGLDARHPGGAPWTEGNMVFNICTEPAHRRSGYARACLGALLTWFHTDTGVRVVHLNATPEGAIMYQAAGFREPAFPSMRLQLDRLTES